MIDEKDDEADSMLEGLEAAMAEFEAAPNGEGKPEDTPEAAEPAAEAPEEPAEAETQTGATEEVPEAEKPQDGAQEAQELRLSDRAAKRFEELREYKTRYAELETQAKQAGFDLAQIGQVFERARERDDLVTMVSETGATPEQFGKSLDYMRDVHQAMTGDTKAAQRAWDALMPEVQALAQMLGKELPGTVDPLDAHPDLVEAVNNGDIARALALELVAARGQGRVHENVRETQQAQAVEQQAIGWLQQFDAQMTAQDATYAAKRPMLDVMVRNIRATLPPSRWPQAVQEAYATIPTIAPPAAKPKPGPVRPHTPPAQMDVGSYDTMEAAIEAATRAFGAA